MDDMQGRGMDLTGLSAETLLQVRELLSRRIDAIQRRNNGLPKRLCMTTNTWPEHLISMGLVVVIGSQIPYFIPHLLR